MNGCAWGLILMVAGLGVWSYHVRELLVFLALFSAAFFCLALSAVGAVLVWWAGEQTATWSVPASRDLIAFSRRLIATYGRR
jgi:hypothetical protein